MCTHCLLPPLMNDNLFIISTNSPQNELPPKDLTFSIIRIPNDGQKLSPPSLELDDGLYILLRSQSKTKLATIPSNLRSLTLLTGDDLSEIPHCPWSLSGPQYPRRAGERVQQRYCYPRGVGEYSNGKGGSMWTVVNKKGQEDIDCRLLHVYHSSKRADNAKPKAKRGRGRPRKEESNNIASTNTAHTSVGTRKSKRKKSQAASTFHQDDEENDRKKMKITTSSLEQSSSLMKGDLLKSPNNSFDTTNNNNNHMNANLDFTGNIFDTTTTTNTTFMPVQNEVMMMNNPAFNSAAAAGVVPGYYGQYAAAAASHHAAANCITYPPPIFGGGSRSAAYPSGDYWTMSSRAPSIPELASSFEWQQLQQPGAASTTISSVDEFSKRLKDVEAQLTSDVEGSKSTDQVLKLHLLQQWAKGIAQKPLQPSKSSLAESKTEVELSSQVVDDAKSVLPMEITEKKDQADEQPIKLEASNEDICSTTEVVLKEASTALAKTNLNEVVKTSNNFTD